MGVGVCYVKGGDREKKACVGVCAGYVRRKRERDRVVGCVCKLRERKTVREQRWCVCL